jgi:hypothetical protein
VLDSSQDLRIQDTELLENILAVSFPQSQGLDVTQQHSQARRRQRAMSEGTILGSGAHSGEEFGNMAVVRLSHGHGLLMQVIDAESAGGA